jgi:hypothetical protein
MPGAGPEYFVDPLNLSPLSNYIFSFSSQYLVRSTYHSSPRFWPHISRMGTRIYSQSFQLPPRDVEGGGTLAAAQISSLLPLTSPFIHFENLHRFPSLLIQLQCYTCKCSLDGQRIYQPRRAGRDGKESVTCGTDDLVSVGKTQESERRGEYINFHISYHHYVYIEFLQNYE